MKKDRRDCRGFDAAFTNHKNRRISELIHRRLNERKILKAELAKWGMTLDSSFTSLYNIHNRDRKIL